MKANLAAKGVAAEQLTTAGFGPDRPLPGNTNASDAERAANRRIEFIVL